MMEAFAVWASFYSNQWSVTGPAKSVVCVSCLWESVYKRSIAVYQKE